jgi:hypothetical protein
MTSAAAPIHRLHHWHQAPAGLLAVGLLEAIALYIVASLAIDTGSLWYYGLALVLLAGVVQSISKLVTRLIRKKK